MAYVVVDGANVVGSRPDGWWRDRAGAAARLAARLDAALRRDPAAFGAAFAAGPDTPLRVLLVLEGAARAAEPGPLLPAVEIVRATGDGDSAIAALCAALAAAGEDDVVVVTADRGLRARVHAAGARATGPSTLLRLLAPPAGEAPGPGTALS
jgi:hypothetical protein